MRTLMTKRAGLVLISILMLFGLMLPYDLSWGADHTIPSPELMPQVMWTRGCGPTSTSMVLGYYDNYVSSNPNPMLGRGRMIDYWMDLSVYVDGRTGTFNSVPNLLEELRIYMSTDGEGTTQAENFGPAIRKLTFDKGYYFDSNDCDGSSGDNDDCWEDIVYEISQGRPFVWHIGYQDGDPVSGHALAAWGYTDAKYVIVYNTWNYGRDDWFYATYDHNTIFTDKQYVTSAVPDGTDGDSQVFLDDSDYWQALSGGQIFTIKWQQWGTFISNVDLLYSDDGGQNFNLIAQDVPSGPGLNSYDWRVPNINTSFGRVRVMAYEPTRNYSWYGYVASDGTQSDFIIYADTTPPVGFIAINGGATYAISPAVTLTLSAGEGFGQSGVNQMCISNTNSCTAWEPYRTTRTWSLPGGDGAKTVYAFFNDNAGNVSPMASASIILDTTPPSGAITINNGDAYTASTSVKLGLSASDANGVPQMCISSSPSYCSAWEPFATSRSCTLLPGDGAKTVYARFKDGAGNLSDLYSQSIILDTSAPTGSVKINGGAAFTNSPSVKLTLSASDLNGATQMCIRESTYIPCAGAWQPYATTAPWTLGEEGMNTVNVRFMDAAGNTSPWYSDSIILDTTAPTGSVKINDGAAYTNSTTVNLALSASDLNGVTQMCIHNDTKPLCASFEWQPYSMFTDWLLSSRDGKKTVYVMFKDAAGNPSPLYSKSIILDTSVPAGSVTINGGAKYTGSTSVNLTLSASGATKVCIRNNLNTMCDLAAWEPYAKIRPWQLSGGDGQKTVYVMFSDDAYNVSPMYSKSITLDTTPPTEGTLSAVPGNGQVSLKWSGFSDGGSGVATYTLLVYTMDHPGGRSEGTKIYSGAGTSYVHKGLTNGALYYYRLCATDHAGNTSTGMTAGAIPGTSRLDTISTPATPSGRRSGIAGTSYSYSTHGSTSSLGHKVEYQFDWVGDGSDLSPWGSATQSRTWAVPGAYKVRARARSTTDTRILSNWSDGLSVTISAPAISVTPTVYKLGNVKVGESKAASFAVRNIGGANLSISNSAVTGTVTDHRSSTFQPDKST